MKGCPRAAEVLHVVAGVVVAGVAYESGERRGEKQALRRCCCCRRLRRCCDRMFHALQAQARVCNNLRNKSLFSNCRSRVSTSGRARRVVPTCAGVALAPLNYRQQYLS